jgi:glycosyltransferase involved in cell wall biosynthesis
MIETARITPQRAPNAEVELSVLIPVYNEAESVPELRDRLTSALDAVTWNWEVVFANDGSTDGSGALLDAIAAADCRFKIVHLRRNFGQTAALMAALDHSRGTVIVMMDADLQNDPADVGELLRTLESGYDVVSGWRTDRRDKEWGRRWPSRLANMLISRLSGVHLHDYGCTLKAYRRWTIENIRLYGEMHRYIPVYASWQGARVIEVPVQHLPRKYGQSKYGLSRATRVFLDLLVIYFFDQALDRPMQFFGKLGLYALLGSFAAGVWAVWLRVFEHTSFIQTPLPLLVTLLAITALLCCCLGILSEMVMRTYFAVGDRRAYLVARTTNVD